MCANIPGSHTCSCAEGFILSDVDRICKGIAPTLHVLEHRQKLFTSFLDIDECIDASQYNCEENSFCRNIPGNYSCECVAGFTREGNAESQCKGNCIAAGHLGINPYAFS